MAKHPVPKRKRSPRRSARVASVNANTTLQKLKKAFTRLVIDKVTGEKRLPHVASKSGNYNGRIVKRATKKAAPAPKKIKAE